MRPERKVLNSFNSQAHLHWTPGAVLLLSCTDVLILTAVLRCRSTEGVSRPFPAAFPEVEKCLEEDWSRRNGAGGMEREERSSATQRRAARERFSIPAHPTEPNRTEPLPVILSEPHWDQFTNTFTLPFSFPDPLKESKKAQAFSHLPCKRSVKSRTEQDVRFRTRVLHLPTAGIVPLIKAHFTFREPVLHFLVTHGTSRNAVQSWTLTALLTFLRRHVTHQCTSALHILQGGASSVYTTILITHRYAIHGGIKWLCLSKLLLGYMKCHDSVVYPGDSL